MRTGQKQVITVEIYKGETEKSECGNNRVISLLSELVKLYDKILTEKVQNFSRTNL